MLEVAAGDGSPEAAPEANGPATGARSEGPEVGTTCTDADEDASANALEIGVGEKGEKGR